MTLYNGASLRLLVYYLLAFLLVNNVPELFPGLHFDAQLFVHDFNIHVIRDGVVISRLDFVLDYFGTYFTTCLVLHWLFMMHDIRQPLHVPGKVVTLLLFCLGVKEVIDLIGWYNQQPWWWDVLLASPILAILPIQYGRWTLQGVTSDNICTGNAVYKLYLMPVDLMDLVALVPGAGVGGFKVLVCVDGHYYISGYKNLKEYYTSEPISWEHLQPFVKNCVVKKQPIKAGDCPDVLSKLQSIVQRWDPFFSTCIGTPTPVLVKYGAKVHSRWPAIDLLFSLKQ